MAFTNEPLWNSTIRSIQIHRMDALSRQPCRNRVPLAACPPVLTAFTLHGRASRQWHPACSGSGGQLPLEEVHDHLHREEVRDLLDAGIGREGIDVREG